MNVIDWYGGFGLPLTDLNETDQMVVRECIRSAAFGPFYPDWEFQTLFGFERQEMQALLDTWPKLDDTNEEVYSAICNSMNNLLHYPIDNPHRWNEFVSVSRDEVARIFVAWRGKIPSSPIDGMR